MGTQSSINPTLELRIQEASKVLKTQKSDLIAFLSTQLGISTNDEGLQLLDAETTSEKIISDILETTYPKLAALAAGAILKGRDPFKKAQPETPITVVNNSSGWQVSPTTTTSNATTLIDPNITNQFMGLTKTLRDPKQLKNRELLEMYDRDRGEYEIEQELHRRANYSHFIVLKTGTEIVYDTSESVGKKPIDIEMSLELLKRSRRMTNPTIVRQGDVFVNVYRITELNPEDQLIELCPFCGESVYKGYCEHCDSDLQGMTGEIKSFLKLIAESDTFDRKVMSDRKAVLISAGKGLEDLRKTWPRIAKQFDELKMVNGLPSLVIRKSLPSSKPADPFHIKN
jgi:hypothetical protein